MAETNYLQENIDVFKSLPKADEDRGRLSFHKAGHLAMYIHFNLPFEEVSIENYDSIEDDLSYESLQQTNIPKQFALIALGGIMMEWLISMLAV